VSVHITGQRIVSKEKNKQLGRNFEKLTYTPNSHMSSLDLVMKTVAFNRIRLCGQIIMFFLTLTLINSQFVSNEI
jgi:hypothetical protein